MIGAVSWTCTCLQCGLSLLCQGMSNSTAVYFKGALDAPALFSLLRCSVASMFVGLAMYVCFMTVATDPLKNPALQVAANCTEVNRYYRKQPNQSSVQSLKKIIASICMGIPVWCMYNGKTCAWQGNQSEAQTRQTQCVVDVVDSVPFIIAVLLGMFNGVLAGCAYIKYPCITYIW